MTSNRDANGSPAHDTSDAVSAPHEGGDLRETIEDARERLGHTIEELAAKLDVKGQVQAKAADAKAHLHEAAAGTAAQAQEKAAQAAHAAQTAGVQAKEQLSHVVATLTELTEKVQDRAPARVRAAVERAGQGSRAWLPWAVAGVAAGALVALVVCRWAGRRS